MSREEIMKTAGSLIIAGSESTATLLSGAIYYLLKNPTSLRKLRSEIDSKFPDDLSEITFAKLASLPYLNAVLQETLRVYPPVPGILPRRTQLGGAVINGHLIAPDVGFRINSNRLSSQSLFLDSHSHTIEEG